MKNTHLHFFFLFITSIVFAININAQPFGHFIRFDGIDDELSIDASSVLLNNSDFTIEFWFRTCQDSLNFHQAFLGSSNDIEINMFPGLDKTYYQLCANSTINVWTCFQDHQYPTDLDWHHLAVTYDYSADEFEFYFDGIDGTVSTSNDYDFSTNGFLYIGRSDYQSWLYKNFNGYIDEMRISNTIRYTESFTPTLNEFTPDEQTTGLWHFNDDLFDDSGNDAHFSSSGNPEIIYFENVTSESNEDLIALDGFEAYQWLDCSNNHLPIPDETEQVFSPRTTGVYAVEVLENTCPLVSDCYDITVTGVELLLNELGINVYPNPTSSLINIVQKTKDEMNIELWNNLGDLFYSETIHQESLSIDVRNLPVGIYIVRLKTEAMFITKKISII